MRPSELWGVTWPLAAFYFDRAVRNWANFVDQRSNEAEQAVRMQMKNRRGTDGFALQAREVAWKKLLGMDVQSSYAAPPVIKNAEGKVISNRKRDIDKVSIPTVLNAEGKKVDLSKFNG